jgi:chromosome segregation protein
VAEVAPGARRGSKVVRARIREASAQLDKVVDTAHGAEVSSAGRRLRLDQVRAKALEEYAVDVAELVAEYGPDAPVPAGDDEPPAAYDRHVQQSRANTAQRQLDQLGKVNPLALEEFAALEERHAFLVTQLEDLRKTRRNLLTVVKEGWHDCAGGVRRRLRRHRASSSRPGPHCSRAARGKPADRAGRPLATASSSRPGPLARSAAAVAVIGGERSPTAIAFLVAIFKARPSPFYVLDEVEAALDDTNVQRLLDIFDELRSSSQLIIITHQKRTMEIADSLYGVSMRADGVSAVISQRLREREPA